MKTKIDVIEKGGWIYWMYVGWMRKKTEAVVGDKWFEFGSWWCWDELLRERVPYRDYSGWKEIFSCVCFGDGDHKFESVTSGGSILRKGE